MSCGQKGPGLPMAQYCGTHTATTTFLNVPGEGLGTRFPGEGPTVWW